LDCHPEAGAFCPLKDLSEPREAACPEQAKRAERVALFATR